MNRWYHIALVTLLLLLLLLMGKGPVYAQNNALPVLTRELSLQPSTSGTLTTITNKSTGGGLLISTLPTTTNLNDERVLLINTSNEVTQITLTNLLGTTAWRLTGNSGTDSTTAFIGTTDEATGRPLILKTDGAERMRITGTGSIGIGTSNPSALLDVGGSLRASGTVTLGSVATGTSADEVLLINGSNQVTKTTRANLVAGSGWALTGNAGTVAAGGLGNAPNANTNFIGTTDAVTLSLVTNNVIEVQIGSNGVLQTAKDMLVRGVTVGRGTSGDVSSVALGSQALGAISNTGLYNTGVGAEALKANTSGLNNTAVGALALRANTTGQTNTAVGASALPVNTTGGNNTAIGYRSLHSNSTGAFNTAVGEMALERITTGSNNTALGRSAGIGTAAPFNLTGSNSVFVGSEAQPLSDAQTNQIVIGYQATGLGSNSAILGNSSITATRLQGRVGIGMDPTGASNVTGLFVRAGSSQSTNNLLELQNNAGTALVSVGATGTVTLGSVAAGTSADEVLLINASNQVTKTTRADLIAGSAWALTGNANINPTNNFLGTTDAQPLIIKTNGAERMRITAAGDVVLGSGDGTGTTAASILRGPNRTGIDAAGEDLTIRAGNGTGTGGSGDITFATATPTGSTQTANVLTERLRITNTGLVGVATATPGARLQVNTGSNATTGMILRANSTLQTANLLEMQSWDGTTATAVTTINASGNILTKGTLRVEGVATFANTDVILGSGDGTGTTAASILRGPNRTGTDAAGVDLTIRAGNGTGTGGSGDIRFFTATPTGSTQTANVLTERLRITKTGLVNVANLSGTPSATVPSGYDRIVLANTDGSLEEASISSVVAAGVAGNAWALTGNTNINPATNFLGTTDAQPLVIKTSGIERMRVAATNGFVGIGVNAPLNPLHVFSTVDDPIARFERSVGATATGLYNVQRLTLTSLAGAQDGFGPRLAFEMKDNSGSYGDLASIGAVRSGADNTGALVMYTSVSGTPTERMRLASNGNVGIGTSTPANTLDVTGTFRASGTATLTDLGGTAASSVPPNYDRIVLANSSGTLDQASISSVVAAGIVGNAWALAGNSITDPATQFLGTNSNQPLIIKTNGAERMRVLSGGNVGIGINDPQEKLHVAGDMRLTNQRTRSITREIPTTVGQAVAIGSMSLTNGGGSFWISITVPSSSFSVAKQYVMPVQYNQTGSDWRVVTPTQETGNFSFNDFELDAKMNNGNLELRIRRSQGSTAGTAYIVIRQEGLIATGLSESTTVTSVTAPTATLYGPLSVDKGGTGATTLTGLVHGNGTSPMTGVTTSAGIAGAISDETGTGALVFGTSPTVSTLTVSSGGAAVTGNLTLNTVADGVTADEVLLINASNQVTKTTRADLIAGSAWALTGNAGTDSTTAFIGTTDEATGRPLILKTDGAERMRITGTGSIGIGTSNPAALLDVGGSLRASGTVTLGSVAAGTSADEVLLINASNQVTKTSRANLVAGSGWALTGNAGTTESAVLGATATNNFLGTTDARSLSLVTNNVVRVQVSSTGVMSTQNDMRVNGLTLGRGGGSMTENTALGLNALNANTTGYNNTAAGSAALASNTTGYTNTAFGRSALSANSTGSGNTAVGSHSLISNTTATGNTAVGEGALYYTTSGGDNTGIGTGALRQTTGSKNTALGYGAGNNFRTGTHNTVIGNEVMREARNGSHNVAIGTHALFGTDGSSNVALGSYAGYNETGSNKLYIANSGSNNLIYGDFSTGVVSINAGSTPSAPGASLQVNAFNASTKGLIVKGAASASANLVEVQNSSGTALVSVSATGTVTLGSVAAGTSADEVLLINASNQVTKTTRANLFAGSGWALAGNAGTDSTLNFLGTTDARPLVLKVNNTERVRIDGGGTMTTTEDMVINGVRVGSGGGGIATNTAVGSNALSQNTTGDLNVAIGTSAMFTNTTGNSNTATGRDALYSNTTGNNNTAYGTLALRANTIGSFNTAVGRWALHANTEGNSNTAVGMHSLYTNTTGQYNTAMGVEALYTNLAGSYNVALGYQAGKNETGGNKLYIANSETNNLIYGDFSTGLVSINAGSTPSAPGASLQVNAFNASTKGLIVKGAASASANLVEVQNSAGTALVSISSAGLITATAGVNLSGASSPLQANGSAGNSGEVLTSAGAGNTPTWQSASTAAGIKSKGVSALQTAQSTYEVSLASLDAGDAITVTLEGADANAVIPSYFVVRTVNSKFTVYFSAPFTGYINWTVMD